MEWVLVVGGLMYFIKLRRDQQNIAVETAKISRRAKINKIFKWVTENVDATHPNDAPYIGPGPLFYLPQWEHSGGAPTLPPEVASDPAFQSRLTFLRMPKNLTPAGPQLMYEQEKQGIRFNATEEEIARFYLHGKSRNEMASMEPPS